MQLDIAFCDTRVSHGESSHYTCIIYIYSVHDSNSLRACSCVYRYACLCVLRQWSCDVAVCVLTITATHVHGSVLHSTTGNAAHDGAVGDGRFSLQSQREGVLRAVHRGRRVSGEGGGTRGRVVGTKGVQDLDEIALGHCCPLQSVFDALSILTQV